MSLITGQENIRKEVSVWKLLRKHFQSEKCLFWDVDRQTSKNWRMIRGWALAVLAEMRKGRVGALRCYEKICQWDGPSRTPFARLILYLFITTSIKFLIDMNWNRIITEVFWFYYKKGTFGSVLEALHLSNQTIRGALALGVFESR